MFPSGHWLRSQGAQVESGVWLCLLGDFGRVTFPAGPQAPSGIHNDQWTPQPSPGLGGWLTLGKELSVLFLTVLFAFKKIVCLSTCVCVCV